MKKNIALIVFLGLCCLSFSPRPIEYVIGGNVHINNVCEETIYIKYGESISNSSPYRLYIKGGKDSNVLHQIEDEGGTMYCLSITDVIEYLNRYGYVFAYTRFYSTDRERAYRGKAIESYVFLRIY